MHVLCQETDWNSGKVRYCDEFQIQALQMSAEINLKKKMLIFIALQCSPCRLNMEYRRENVNSLFSHENSFV